VPRNTFTHLYENICAFFFLHFHVILILWFVCVYTCIFFLQHFKKQRRLIPERTVWKYFVQLCSALEHMHSRRVMHRGSAALHLHLISTHILSNDDLMVDVCESIVLHWMLKMLHVDLLSAQKNQQTFVCYMFIICNKSFVKLWNEEFPKPTKKANRL